MLWLRAYSIPYIVDGYSAMRHGCVIDTLFHTLCRAVGARSQGPWDEGESHSLEVQTPMLRKRITQPDPQS
jgi:hypothetical protein